MDKFELQKLRDLPIEGVAERLGLQVVRHKCLCPFHDDHHASLSFFTSRNTFRCFACGAHGGTIDLAMRYLSKDFLEACKWLADDAALVITSFRHNDKTTKEGPPFDACRYARFFEHPFLNEEARRFLFEERRLDSRVVRWCRLTSWKDKRGVPWLQIPYFDREGRLTGVQNRNLTYGSGLKVQGSGLESQDSINNHEPLTMNREPRFRFPVGSECGIYNLPVLNRLKPGEPLFITEGCSDCWAMLSSGHKAIAIPSATLLKPKDVEQLLSLSSSLGLSLHMYPDRDEPGERLFLQLQNILPHLVHHQLPLGCKDFSDYYLRDLKPTKTRIALYDLKGPTGG